MNHFWYCNLSFLFVLYLGMLKNSNNYGKKKSNVTGTHDLQVNVSCNNSSPIYVHKTDSGILRMLNSFNLTESNCYEKNLKINFYLQMNVREEAKLITSYLEQYKVHQNNHFYFTSEKQEYSLYCSRIKRYYINRTHHIVFIDEHAHFVKTSEMDHFIGMDFLKNLNLVTYVFFKIDHYDEEKNDILFGEFFWTLVRLLTLFDFLKTIRNYLMKKLSSYINIV
jgi:hypothetical protein